MVASVSMVTVRSVANPSIVTVLIVCRGGNRCHQRQENPVNWSENHGWMGNGTLENVSSRLINSDFVFAEYLSLKISERFPGAESCSDIGAALTYSLLIQLSSLHPSVSFTLPFTKSRNINSLSLHLTHTDTHILVLLSL